MAEKITLLAISGSTRKASSNLNLIKAITGLSSELFTIKLFDGLDRLPHFNPDLLTDDLTPVEVTAFRKQIKDADGILICTPEYAIGVPGTLKNAIDWTVSSMEFSGKPVALITASLSGEKAHQSLLGTLLIIEAKMTTDTQLLVPFVKSKVNDDAQITDPGTLHAVNKLLRSLAEIIRNKDGILLSAPILMNDGINSGNN
jgi:chromate reductase